MSIVTIQNSPFVIQNLICDECGKIIEQARGGGLDKCTNELLRAVTYRRNSEKDECRACLGRFRDSYDNYMEKIQ